MGRHSIKVKIASLLTVIIAALLVLLILFNSIFAEKFYLKDKQKAMLDTYNNIEDILDKYDNNEITESQMSDSIEKAITGNATAVLVVNSDWSIVYVSTKAEGELMGRLRMSIFNGDIFEGNDSQQKDTGNSTDASTEDSSKAEKPTDTGTDDKGPGDKYKVKPDDKSSDTISMLGSGAVEKREIIKSTDQYTLQKIYDDRMGDDYLELWGTLDNGDSIILRTAIQGIKDNIKISNTLIRYVGIAVLVVGVIAAFIFSNYISRPIKQLSHIAERMAHMDFEAKYDGSDKGEIGLLGNSMNNMSRKLEENISQLKAANLELKKDIDKKEKLEEMRTEFLSNVSHELKTPIALIQGYAEGLKEGISDDPESMDFYCNVIIDEASKMNTMVKKLLTLNQIEFGKDDLTVERFDIAELVESVVNTNELRASQKDIRIVFENKGQHIFAWGDEYKIEEVVTNYISNAVNHCEGEKLIRVRIDCDNENARVSVFNTGKNIPQEDIDRIWDKFYKVDKARTREYGGNGIGLSIVKAIMDSLGKGYGVQNKPDGVEFWFDLDTRC